MPIFDFKISKSGFYINADGVSVTELEKSFTRLADGKFYVLNKNNIPLYFQGLTISSVKFRNETGLLRSDLRVRLLKNETIDNMLYEHYVISFRGSPVGLLILKRKEILANESGVKIYPFTSTEFSASYAALNVNKLKLHYFGKKSVGVDKRVTILDINLNLTTSIDIDNNDKITEPVVLTVKLINTGYVPKKSAVTIGELVGDTLEVGFIDDVTTTLTNETTTIEDTLTFI